MLENPLLAMARQSGAPEAPKKPDKKSRLARPDIGDLTGDPYDERPRSELVDEKQEAWLEQSEGEVRDYIDGLDMQARESGFGLPDWQDADGAASEYHGTPTGIPQYLQQGEYDRLMSVAHAVTPEKRKALKRSRKQMQGLYEDFAIAHPEHAHSPGLEAAASRVARRYQEEGLPRGLLEKKIEQDRESFLMDVAIEADTAAADYVSESAPDGRTVDLGSFASADLGGSADDEHREGPGLASMLNEAQKRDGYL